MWEAAQQFIPERKRKEEPINGNPAGAGNPWYGEGYCKQSFLFYGPVFNGRRCRRNMERQAASMSISVNGRKRDFSCGYGRKAC
jgi:hypothetical protein